MRPRYPLLGSLSEDVFERRKSNRSGLFAFLGSNFAYPGGIFPVGVCRAVLQILTLWKGKILEILELKQRDFLKAISNSCIDLSF